MSCVEFDYLFDSILGNVCQKVIIIGNECQMFLLGSLKLFHYTITNTINLELVCVFPFKPTGYACKTFDDEIISETHDFVTYKLLIIVTFGT